MTSYLIVAGLLNIDANVIIKNVSMIVYL